MSEGLNAGPGDLAGPRGGAHGAADAAASSLGTVCVRLPLCPASRDAAVPRARRGREVCLRRCGLTRRFYKSSGITIDLGPRVSNPICKALGAFRRSNNALSSSISPAPGTQSHPAAILLLSGCRGVAPHRPGGRGRRRRGAGGRSEGPTVPSPSPSLSPHLPTTPAPPAEGAEVASWGTKCIPTHPPTPNTLYSFHCSSERGGPIGVTQQVGGGPKS